MRKHLVCYDYTGGGTGALDSYSHTLFENGSRATVITDGLQSEFRYNSTSTATEDSPFVIAPDSGTGRWILQGRVRVSYVDSYAELRALPVSHLSAGHVLYSNGGSSVGDGGEGYFKYVSGAAASTYTDDGGIVILPTGGDGSAAWVRADTGPVDVKWFGACGDGATDDTTAIQAGIDYLSGNGGGLLWFPKGYYNFTTLTAASNGIVFEGTGRRSSVLVSTLATGDGLTFGGLTSIVAGVGMRHIGMTQDTGVTKTAGAALRIEGVTDATFIDMDIRGWFDGVVVAGCARCDFENIWMSSADRATVIANKGFSVIYDNTAGIGYCINIKLHAIDMLSLNGLIPFCVDGFYFDCSDSIFMDSCHANRTTNALRVHAMTTTGNFFIGLWVSNCYFDRSEGRNVYIDGDCTQFGDIIFNGCEFRKSAYQNIYFSSDSTIENVQITGCQLRESNTQAILDNTGKVQQLSVTDNIFYRTNESGTASIADASYKAGPVLHCNNIHQGGAAGAYCVGLSSAVDGCQVKDNDFSQSLSDGISDSGATNAQIGGNIGHVTAAKGVGTILSGSTSITVAHGLDVVPSTEDVQISAKNAPTNDAGRLFVDGVGATNIIVKCESDPGAGGLSFCWWVDTER